MTIHDQEAPSRGIRTAALFRAEWGRATRTRSTVVLLALAALATLAIFATRALLVGNTEDPLEGDLVVLSADVIGFSVFLAAALAISRDHQSGSVELVRVLVPTRGRQLLAFAAAHAALAVAVVLVVITVGIIVSLAVDPSTGVSARFVDGAGRLMLTTALLAVAGSGLGSLCRSSALATFVALALYLLLPIALIVAGFTGQPWASSVADGTLGVLASTAISSAPGAWVAVAGVMAWAAALMALGLVRARTDS